MEISGIEFSDLTDEQYRQYEFPGGDIVRIDNPVGLNVSESGGHRVFDKQGIAHYIPKGWIHLTWKVHEGKPIFAF